MRITCKQTHRFALSVLKTLRRSVVVDKAIAGISESHSSYLSIGIDPDAYESASDFASDYLAVELMSKYPFLDVDIDRVGVAMKKFVDVEENLSQVGVNLTNLKRGAAPYGVEHPFHHILFCAERKINRLLGSFNWDRAERFFNFGPGACIGITRLQSDAYNKYGCLKPSVTPGCLDLACAYFEHVKVFRDLSPVGPLEEPGRRFSVVPGNKVVTVLKNAKTDRVIAIEPQMNMFFQKGIGGLIRSRLKRVGVDLDDQLPNQELARLGSIDGSLATIDLASASDSVSLALCELLLPSSWLDACKAVRSPRGVLPDGSYTYYRKVSSMGNGFTFELESLFFWALSEATIEYLSLSDRRLGVYGDDLVVPASAVSLLCDILSFCGFTTNVKKTHTTGLFRESCGKHWFSGTEVTPFYIKDRVVGDERLVWFANTLRSYAHRKVGIGYGCCDSLKPLWDDVISRTSRSARSCKGPLFFGASLNDTSIGLDFDEVCPPRARNGCEGYTYRALHRRYGKRRFYDQVAYTHHMFVKRRSIPLLSGEGVSTTEYPTQRYRVTVIKTVTPRWQNVGPWVRFDDSV